MSADTPASSQTTSIFLPLAPIVSNVLRSKPSWIGRPPPARPSTPSMPTMKQDVRISYTSKGLKAPVYIVSSLSEPQWEPIELSSTPQADGELEFWKVFEVEEGEYQYKFRLGPGDWWVLDEGKPVVDDGTGNRNNTIRVEAPKPAQPPKVEQAQAPAVPETAKSVPDSTPRGSLDQAPPPVPPKDTVTAAVKDAVKDTLNALMITSPEPAQEGPAPPAVDDKKHQITLLGPAAPLTPPMTPEMRDLNVIDEGKFQPFPVAEIERPASAASHYSDKSVEEGIAAPEKKDEVTVIQTPPKEGQTGIVAAVRYFVMTLGSWILGSFGNGMRATGILAVFIGLAAIIYNIRDIKDAIFPSALSALFPPYGKRDDSSLV